MAHDRNIPPASGEADGPVRQFGSDNRSGICPEAWAAMQQANEGHAASYGDDRWSARARALLRELFETDCDAYFAATGTAANSMALSALCRSYHGVICHEVSHIETDECSAPAFFSGGLKLLPAGGANGKLDAATVRAVAARRTDVHAPLARAVSLTQATELGTLYTPGEVADICAAARQSGLYVQMDGARFGNAIAALGCAPAEVTWKAGVDVLCLGGTKNGMFCAEAVVFFNKPLGQEFAYRRKQAGQLLSKMRFVTAQWAGMLEGGPGGRGGAWLRHAAHANRMARQLGAALTAIQGVNILCPVQANAVFADIPPAAVDGLRRRGWELYTFIGESGMRFMCSWDTAESDIERVANDLRAAMSEIPR